MACWCDQSLSKLVYSRHLPPLCLHSSSYGARFVLKALCGNLLFLLREWLWVGQRWEAHVQESYPPGCVCVCGGEPPCQDPRGPLGNLPTSGEERKLQGLSLSAPDMFRPRAHSPPPPHFLQILGQMPWPSPSLSPLVSDLSSDNPGCTWFSPEVTATLHRAR